MESTLHKPIFPELFWKSNLTPPLRVHFLHKRWLPFFHYPHILPFTYLPRPRTIRSSSNSSCLKYCTTFKAHEDRCINTSFLPNSWNKQTPIAMYTIKHLTTTKESSPTTSPSLFLFLHIFDPFFSFFCVSFFSFYLLVCIFFQWSDMPHHKRVRFTHLCWLKTVIFVSNRLNRYCIKF